MRIELSVNGAPAVVEARTDELLHTVLARELGLRSARETCGIGVCGACTVLLDGEPVSGCLLLAVEADGSAVTTVEGLGGDDPVQRAFEQAHAFQCGWCTPGLDPDSLSACWRETPDPGRGRDPHRARRQPLPLRLVREDRRGGAARRGVKLVTYDAGSGPRVGVLEDGVVSDAGFDGDMVAFIAAGRSRRRSVRRSASARLLAPLTTSRAGATS